MSEEYLTVIEAAGKLSVSPRTIQRYCKQDLLNYKWVTGKRHKELRIIPPIEASNLPGVRHKTQFNPSDFVTKENFVTITGELKNRIKELETKLEMAKTASAAATGVSDTVSDSAQVTGDIHEKTRSFLKDFEKVRPIEKKLILKMAEEIKAHGEFLSSLGMDTSAQDESDTN
ncbi:DUF3294 domain-containing protein [Candidatus Latescibacterota bacterium]